MANTDHRNWLGHFLGVSALLGSNAGALCADLEAWPRQRTLSFTPYGWLPGLNGDTPVKSRTTDVDVGPFMVLESLDGVPWMSYAEARSSRLGPHDNIFYAPVGVDASGTRSFGRLSVDAAPVVDIEQTIVEAGAACEIDGWWSTAASASARSEVAPRTLIS